MALIILAAAASASAPKRHPVQKAMKTEASFDRTWSALIEVFAENNWPIQTLEKDSGLISTDWLNLGADSTYADCGSSGLATVVARGLRFNVFVREQVPGAVVTVNATFRELRRFNGREAFVDCNSTGAVEANIHAQVDSITSVRHPPPESDPESHGASCCGAELVIDGVVAVSIEPLPQLAGDRMNELSW